MGLINIDTKGLVDEAAATIVPQVEKTFSDAVTSITSQLPPAIVEALTGLTITITISKKTSLPPTTPQ